MDEAIAILKHIRKRPGMANALKTLFNPPGWAPGVDSQTVPELRRAAARAAAAKMEGSTP
jgi:hypothetical protein